MHDLPHTDDEFAPAPPVPGWPKGIGITSIVLASLGLCCGVCGVGMMFAQGSLMKMAPAEMGTPPDVMFASPGQMILAATGVPFSLVLLFAGIACMRRKASGRMLHLIYAIPSILLAVPGTWLAIQQINAQAAWKAANSGDKWAQQMHPEFGYFGVAIGLLFSLAWPVFAAIWFGLMSKKPEVGAPESTVI